MDRVLQKAYVKGLRKQWERIKKKYGYGSKYEQLMFELDESGKRLEVEKMADEAIRKCNDILEEIQMLEKIVDDKYWSKILNEIKNEVEDVKELYESFL